MKLYIKQKVFSWKDKFKVYDEAGNEKYFVEGEFFSWGKKLHVYDLEGKEVAFIKQELLSFLPRFKVFLGDREVAEIVKNFTFFKPKYSIEGLGWEIKGDFWSHDYVVCRGELPIVNISKEWMTWGDCYELDIMNPSDEIVALSVVLTIDCVMAQANSAAAT